MQNIQSITEQVFTLVNQISILGMLGLTGYIAGKTRYLPDNSGVVISRVVIKLTAPLLIFTTLASRSFTKDILINGIWIYTLGIFFMLVSFAAGHTVSKALKLKGATENIFKMHFMFGNVIFLAFPLLKSLYGDDGVVYAVLFNLANDTILWTLGIYLVNKHNKIQFNQIAKHLINGNTIAFGSGLIIILLKTNFKQLIDTIPYIYDISGFVFKTFHPLGETTVYLSMLFIGLILSEIRITSAKDLLKRYPIFILTLFKLIIIPIFALLLLTLLGGLIDPLAKAIIVLQLAMPCATIVPALAAQYDSDYRFATENVFFTTILGIATMPFIVYLIMVIG